MESGGLYSAWGSQKLDMTDRVSTHTVINLKKRKGFLMFYQL